jgi:hypothetical protein
VFIIGSSKRLNKNVLWSSVRSGAKEPKSFPKPAEKRNWLGRRSTAAFAQLAER